MLEGVVSRELRAAVRWRAQNCCEYCRSQERFATHAFSLDQIVPERAGGASTLSNLALACQGCNNHKYNKLMSYDPVSAQRVSLFHPREQLWKDHFAWSFDFTLILGLTPTGRATVEALRLNRAGLVELRRVLYAAGEHPPNQNRP